MHRNTYLFVSILAVIAALVVGVNLGHKFTTTTPAATPTPTTIPNAINGQPNLTLYTNAYCGFSLQIPNSLTKLENATGSAILVNQANSKESIVVTCQKDIPRPPLREDRIETISLSSDTTASISAKLYHDASAKDGTPIDELIFRHPKTGMDVFIAGYGTTFNKVAQTLQILQ